MNHTVIVLVPVLQVVKEVVQVLVYTHVVDAAVVVEVIAPVAVKDCVITVAMVVVIKVVMTDAAVIVLEVVDPVAQVERELTVLPVEPPVLEAVVVQDVHRLVEIMDAITDVAPHVEDLVVLNVL